MTGLLLGSLWLSHRVPKDGLEDLASSVPRTLWQVPLLGNSDFSTRPGSGPSEVALPGLTHIHGNSRGSAPPGAVWGRLYLLLAALCPRPPAQYMEFTLQAALLVPKPLLLFAWSPIPYNTQNALGVPRVGFTHHCSKWKIVWT